MKLDDKDSWDLISKCLKNADWKEDEIENISDETLEKVVNILNKKLKRSHKKSSPLTTKAIKNSALLQVWYNCEILKLAEQYGEDNIPFLLVVKLLEKFAAKQKAIEKEFRNSLENL
ncbi:MAG: hypothetical protein LBD41_01770 [Clostridiales Family XIII bacterium]|jgi:hypothetical protein|nr:hypothetical protein [Clostridiales Family XIII bacterium]